MVRTPLKFVCLLLGMMHASFAFADVYGYSDQDGSIYLTDNPPSMDYELLASTPVEAAKVLPPSSFQADLPQSETSIPTNLNSGSQVYHDVVNVAAEASGVESALLHAVITAESNYNPRAVSPKGAAGLMQLMPTTARRFGVSNLFDPAQNVRGGARYLAYLMGLFKNDFVLAVAAYNAGENSVIQHGNKVPPYPETRNYVIKVIDLYKRFARSKAGRKSET